MILEKKPSNSGDRIRHGLFLALNINSGDRTAYILHYYSSIPSCSIRSTYCYLQQIK